MRSCLPPAPLRRRCIRCSRSSCREHGFADVDADDFDDFAAAARPRAAGLHRGSRPLQGNARPRGDRARSRARVSRALPRRRAAAGGRARVRSRATASARWPAFVHAAGRRVRRRRRRPAQLGRIPRRDRAAARRARRRGRRRSALPVKGAARASGAAATDMRKSAGSDDEDFPDSRAHGRRGLAAVEDEELQYLAMPREHEHLRDAARARARRRDGAPARATCWPTFLAHLERWDPEPTARGPRLDLAGVAADGARRSPTRCWARARSASRSTARRTCRIQESVFTGLVARRASSTATARLRRRLARGRADARRSSARPRAPARAPTLRAVRVPAGRDELAGAAARNRARRCATQRPDAART